MNNRPLAKVLFLTILDFDIYLKLKPEDIPVNTPNYRDVSNIGHHGIGDVEFTITNLNELIDTKPFIELAYNKIGG